MSQNRVLFTSNPMIKIFYKTYSFGDVLKDNNLYSNVKIGKFYGHSLRKGQNPSKLPQKWAFVPFTLKQDFFKYQAVFVPL